MEAFIQRYRDKASLQRHCGFSAYAAGMEEVLAALEAERPCSLPVVDAKDVGKLPPGFWDDEYYVLNPEPSVVVE